MPELNRPATTKQSSRKGKRSWRKNIDLTEISTALESNREDEIILGKKFNDETDNLFKLDTKGDDKIDNMVKQQQKQGKLLKSEEILNKRSAIPGLIQKHHEKKKKKFEGVSSKELTRLLEVAGKKGNRSLAATIDKHGLVNTPVFDVWGDEPDKESKKIKKILMDPISSKKSEIVPSSMKQEPISFKADSNNVGNVDIPHAGKSYNPSLESWQALLKLEYEKEKKRQDQFEVLRLKKEKIQHLIDTFEEVEEGESDDESEEEEQDVSEGLGLSANKPIIAKKKTKAQRNRIKRHEERLALEKDLKELKAQYKELQKVDEIQKEVILKTESKVEKQTKQRKRRLGKHYIMPEQLEIKLSDELSGSLRTLKPEGNASKDRFRSLQERGKIEARVPVAKKRRYKPNVTEKWTYKDFK